MSWASARAATIALAAARALLDSDLDAEAIARKAMAIAAEICVYTNNNVVIESLSSTVRTGLARVRGRFVAPSTGLRRTG